MYTLLQRHVHILPATCCIVQSIWGLKPFANFTVFAWTANVFFANFKVFWHLWTLFWCKRESFSVNTQHGDLTAKVLSLRSFVLYGTYVHIYIHYCHHHRRHHHRRHHWKSFPLGMCSNNRHSHSSGSYIYRWCRLLLLHYVLNLMSKVHPTGDNC